MVFQTVTCKEMFTAITALDQNGLTCKEIAAKNIELDRTINQIIKSFKDRGSTVGRKKKASVHPRLSNKCQDCFLLRIQLRNCVATCPELAQQWQLVGVKASACTVRRKLLDNSLMSGGNKEGNSLQEKHS